MKSIKRKFLLYKSKVNYGDYAINHVLGCSHGCRYPCYEIDPKIRRKDVTDYNDWVQPKIVENALELLDKEIPKHKKYIQFVFMCFTTDPFMYGQGEVKELTLKIITKLNKDDIKCVILTKGILPKELTDRKYSRENEYGITLVSLDPEFQKRYEPGAVPLDERLKALQYLHDRGRKTWISIEPYPTPNIINQDFLKLLEKVKFVDKIIFGSWNYNALVKAYPDKEKYYLDCSDILRKFCEKNGIQFHVKSGGPKDGNLKNPNIFH